MSFLFAEKVIEYVIRVGVNDIFQDPTILDRIFVTNKCRDVGADLTPDGASPPIFERTIMDEFQDKMEAIPATKRETGVAPEDRFENELFPIEDMKTYLSQMNISIRHGYPREEKDLPGIFINLGAEDENTYLGDVQHVIQNDSPPEQNIIFGVDVSTSYYLNILSSNYDETIFLYYLVRYALIRYRRVLEVYGMRTPKMSLFSDPRV